MGRFAGILTEKPAWCCILHFILIKATSDTQVSGTDHIILQIVRVFYTSALLIFLLVGFAAVFPDIADKNFKHLQQQIFPNASWFYILTVAVILLSATFLGLSRDKERT